MTEQEWLASEDPAAMLDWTKSTKVDTVNKTAQCEANQRLSDRKLRLFACACARQVWHLLADGRARAAVEAAERFADGVATSKDRGLAFNASDNLRGEQQPIAYGCLRANAAYGAGEAAFHARQCGARPTAQAAVLRCIVGSPHRPVTQPRSESVVLCPNCGRENPTVRFKDMRCLGCGQGTVVVRPGRCPWLTPTALSLAHAAYDERLADGTLDPVRLAVLADALEDDGCEDGPLLRHLRGWERCRPCLGRLRDGRGGPVGGTCPACFDSGWVRSPSHHVRGCWALDLVLRKE